MTRAENSRHLRLLWPQWQGAGAEMVAGLFPEVPLDEARRGYAAGTEVLEAVLPKHDGPTATVPVIMDDQGSETRDGVESKDAVGRQLARALEILREQRPEKITTIGGECSVSVAPFSYLAERYGEDLAVVWVDAHPDLDTPQTEYNGYHAMAVALLTGHGDEEMLRQLPATIPSDRVALTGLHSWTEDVQPTIDQWGFTTFSPEDLRENSQGLLDWIVSTGATKVAIHLDVDVIDSDETVFGLGAEPQGLTSGQVRRLIDDVGEATEVVGMTVAEYVPRQVMQIRRVLAGMPLIPDEPAA